MTRSTKTSIVHSLAHDSNLYVSMSVPGSVEKSAGTAWKLFQIWFFCVDIPLSMCDAFKHGNSMK